MGLFDYLRCEHPLPGFEDPSAIDFQTKDTDEQYLKTYTLRADGSLMGPDGKPDPFHGCLAFYASNVEASCKDGRGVSILATSDGRRPWRADYEALFDRGKLLRIDGAREFQSGVQWLSRPDFDRREASLRYQERMRRPTSRFGTARDNRLLAAVVKGIKEANDPGAHFFMVPGLGDQLRYAHALRLIQDAEGGGRVLTKEGERWYEDAGLAGLPKTSASSWPGPDEDGAADAP